MPLMIECTACGTEFVATWRVLAAGTWREACPTCHPSDRPRRESADSDTPESATEEGVSHDR